MRVTASFMRGRAKVESEGRPPGLRLAPRVARSAAMVSALCCAACGPERATGPSVPSGDPAAFTWQLPVGFPIPLVPADNPMSDAKVELGRRLFYDTRLSGNGAFSC